MLRRNVASVLIAFALSVFAATDAAATAQRTFVASGGNDTNPCSLTHPCRSFAHAITLTSAGGEVIVLDSAGYGPVTITQSVSIIAPAGIYAGISVFSGNGVTINAPGATVVLRGLSINGQGGDNGIYLVQGARIQVEDCLISNMAVDGIRHFAPNAELAVLDTIVRGNGGNGILFASDNESLLLDHVRVEHNAQNGLYAAPTLGPTKASATIGESVFAYNGGNGINAEASAVTVIQVEHSILSHNGGSGFRVFAFAVLGVRAVASLNHNAVHDNVGVGILLTATLPGSVAGTLSENAASPKGFLPFTDAEIAAEGNGVAVQMSANITTGIRCDNATVSSLGNNMPPLSESGCTYLVVPGS